MARKKIIDCTSSIHLFYYMCVHMEHETHTNTTANWIGGHAKVGIFYLIFNRKLMFYITFRLFHLARTEHDNSQVLYAYCIWVAYLDGLQSNKDTRYV